MTERVEYRLVSGYDGFYRVGADGSVWSCKKPSGRNRSVVGAWLRLRPSVGVESGYLSVGLRTSEGKVVWRKVHQLVLEAFVGPRPSPSHVSRHVLNNDPADCRRENLAWGTQTENQNDKRQHGTHIEGAAVWQAKLTDEAVVECRRRTRDGETCVALSREFGVKLPAMLSAVRGETWKHVAEPPNPEYDRRPKLGKEKANEVRELLASGVSGRAIAKRFGVTESVISTIKHNKVYCHASG